MRFQGCGFVCSGFCVCLLPGFWQLVRYQAVPVAIPPDSQRSTGARGEAKSTLSPVMSTVFSLYL